MRPNFGRPCVGMLALVLSLAGGAVPPARAVDPAPELARAETLIAGRQFAQAERLIDALLETAATPAGRAEGLAMKAQARRRAGDLPEAAKLLREALLTDPGCEKARLGEMLLLLQSGDSAAAERSALRLLATIPDHAAATTVAAAAQAARGDAATALSTLSRSADFPPAMLLRASLQLNREEFDLARRDLERYQALAGRDGRSQRLLGAVLLRQRDADQAVTVLNDAVRREPAHQPGIVLLAAAHIQAGDCRAAAPWLDKASRSGPDADPTQADGNIVGDLYRETAIVPQALLRLLAAVCGNR